MAGKSDELRLWFRHASTCAAIARFERAGADLDGKLRPLPVERIDHKSRMLFCVWAL